ncbi:MAG: SDR family oxidoreductase [Acidimicrobiia bacterium]|nr:SDR family oxidoreductase [Acidimicrobiia bacterium]
MAMINQSKRILITGAGRWCEGGEGGLGAALAIRLAGQGHTVVINHRSSDEAAERLVEAIRNGPGRALAVRADVTDPDDVARMARTVRQELGGLDVLINNAGRFLLKDYEDLTPVEWESQIASTATATYYVSTTLLPLLREQRGRIINISDAGADRITSRPRTLPYHIGKMGVLMITRTMARAEAGYGVTVNAIMPGVLENSEPLPDRTRIPAGRHGTADDVLEAVTFLMREKAGYITGAFIQVGGGWNL